MDLFHELIDGALVPNRVQQLANEILRTVQVQKLPDHHGRLLRRHLLDVDLVTWYIMKSGRVNIHITVDVSCHTIEET